MQPYYHQIDPTNSQSSSMIVSENPAPDLQNYNFSMSMDHGLASPQSIKSEHKD